MESERIHFYPFKRGEANRDLFNLFVQRYIERQKNNSDRKIDKFPRELNLEDSTIQQRSIAAISKFIVDTRGDLWNFFIENKMELPDRITNYFKIRKNMGHSKIRKGFQPSSYETGEPHNAGFTIELIDLICHYAYDDLDMTFKNLTGAINPSDFEPYLSKHFKDSKITDFHSLYLHAKENVKEDPDNTQSLSILNDHFSTLYQSDSRFTAINILGNTQHAITSMSMKDYYIDVSYLPIRTIRNNERLLQKEKEGCYTRTRLRSFQINENYLNSSIINDNNRILILGNPGVGKTTYARWICYQWANSMLRSSRIPIYVQLNQLNFDNESDWLLRAALEQSKFLIPIASLNFPTKNISEHLLFILDGFDELGGKRQSALLNYLHHENQTAPFMLLSRPYALVNQYPSVEIAMEILGFNASSRFRYVQKVIGNNKVQFPNKSSTALNKILTERLLLNRISDNPLMLSYVVLIYLHSNHARFDLTKVTSLYHLQYLAIQCLEDFYCSKGRNKAKNQQEFEKIVNQATNLAYVMESGKMFVVDPKIQMVQSVGGSKLLSNLSKIGLGRLSQSDVAQKSFHFITATIQEYLAAIFYSENPDPRTFWPFLLDKLNWNFCRMVIGKLSYTSQNSTIKNIWDSIISHSNTHKQNIQLIYFQLIILSEISSEQANALVSTALVKKYYKHFIKSSSESPLWINILLNPISLFYNKLSRSIKQEFQDYFILEFENNLLSTFNLEIDYNLEIELQSAVLFAKSTRMQHSKTFMTKVIEWIRLIDNEKSLLIEKITSTTNDQSLETKQMNQLHAHLDNIAIKIFSIIQEAPNEIIFGFRQQIMEYIGDEDEVLAISYELQEHIKGVISKVDIWDNLISRLEKITKDDTEFRSTDEYSIFNLIERIGNLVGEKTPRADRILVSENLNNLYKLISQSDLLDIYEIIESIYYTCINLGTIESYELMYEIIQEHPLDTFILSKYDLDFLEFVNNKMLQFPQSTRFEINEQLIEKTIDFLSFLSCTDKGIMFFSQHRETFFDIFEHVIIQNNELINSHTILVESTEVDYETEESQEDYFLIYSLIEIFESIFYNSYFLDKKFVLKRMFQSEISKNNYVRYRVIVGMLRDDIVVNEDYYWRFFNHLTSVDYDPVRIIELIANQDIYLFSANFKNLMPIWNHLMMAMKLENEEKLPKDWSMIFSPAITALKTISKSQPEKIDTAVKDNLISAIKNILIQDQFKSFILNYEKHELELVSYAILTYLYLSFLDPNCINSNLNKAWEDKNLDFITVFSFLTNSMELQHINELEDYMPKKMFTALLDFHSYHSQPKISNLTK